MQCLLSAGLPTRERAVSFTTDELGQAWGFGVRSCEGSGPRIAHSRRRRDIAERRVQCTGPVHQSRSLREILDPGPGGSEKVLLAAQDLYRITQLSDQV